MPEQEPEANVWESEFGEPNPVVVYPTVRKDILRERIETQIEEFREYKDALPDSVDKGYEWGVMLGLRMALQIMEES